MNGDNDELFKKVGETMSNILGKGRHNELYEALKPHEGVVIDLDY